MKINRPNESHLKRQLKNWKKSAGQTGRPDRLDSEPHESPFDEAIKTQKIELLDMKLNDLIDALGQRGDSLADHPTPKNLKQYKQALASFLKQSLVLSKEVQHIIGRRTLQDIQQGEEKKHVIVQTIDEQVDQLSEIVLNREADRVDIAEQLGEIKGLVLDLVSTIKDKGKTT